MANVDEKFKAEGACRLCERPRSGEGGRQLTRHRLVPGRFGGRYEYANTVPLCVPCHRAVEGESPVDRRMLRTKLWSVEVAHVLEHMGSVWLEAMYPKGAGPALRFQEADDLAPAHLKARAKPRQVPNRWTVGEYLKHTRPWGVKAGGS